MTSWKCGIRQTIDEDELSMQNITETLIETTTMPIMIDNVIRRFSGREQSV